MLRCAVRSPDLSFPFVLLPGTQSLPPSAAASELSRPRDLLIFSQVALVLALLASQEAYPKVEMKYGSILASPAPSKRIGGSPCTACYMNGKKRMMFWSRRLFPLCPAGLGAAVAAQGSPGPQHPCFPFEMSTGSLHTMHFVRSCCSSGWT